MGKCSKKQFEESVQNDALSYLGILKVPVLQSDTTKQIRVGAYDGTDVKVKLTILDGKFNSTQTNTIEVAYNADPYVDYIANSDTYIIIEKYNIGKFVPSQRNPSTGNYDGPIGSSYVLKLSDLEYCEHIFTLSCYVNTQGDISSLSKMITMNTLIFEFGNVTGSVTELVKSWIANGRSTSGNCRLNVNKVTGENIVLYFGNKEIGNMAMTYFYWESATKIYLVYDSSHIWCVGYSDSEITTNTASGGIWEGKTVVKCD